MKTPILFLIFNRPETEKRILEAIKIAKPEKIYVAADGPRPTKEGEKIKCEAARRLIDEKIDWGCEVKKLYRKDNMGCKNAVSSAINWFFENEEEGIILEDDCLPSNSFFKFAEEMLDKYRDDERINIISGDNFQKKNAVYSGSYYFSKYSHIWGWATWKRSWEKYDVKIKDWPRLKNDRNIKFGDFIEDKYWRMIFDKVYKGEIDTWDYQLAYTGFKNRLLNVMPAKNLVENIGIGVNATHTFANQEVPRAKEMPFPLKHPKEIVADKNLDKYTRNYHYNLDVLLVIKRLLHL